MKMRKTLLASALALVALAGCTTENEKTPRASYPQEARDNFIDQCTKAAVQTGGGNDADQRKTCTCVIDKLEAELPYRADGDNNDFKDADTLIRERRDLPASLQDKIDKATADCRPA
jgi:hypothetical protein